MLMGSYGIGASLIPLMMSALYKTIKFRSTLDILGVGLSLNTGAFLVHAGRNNWGRKREANLWDEEEEQAMLHA